MIQRWTLLAMLAAIACSAWAQRVAIFQELHFPTMGVTPLATPRQLQAWLAEHGIRADLINAGQLSDANQFNYKRYAILIMPYGNTFPLEAAANIRKFRLAKGSIAAPGVPFTHPVRASGALDWQFEGDTIARGAHAGMSGTAALNFQKQVGRDWIGVTSRRLAIRDLPSSVKPLRFTVSARVKNVSGTSDQDRLFVRFFSGDSFIGQEGPALGAATGQWVNVSQTVTVPEKATAVDLSIQVRTTNANLWVDDASLMVEGQKANLLTNPGFERAGGGRRDLGHEDRWMADNSIGTGFFRDPPADAAELTIIHSANDPLKLDFLRLPAARRVQVYRPGSRDRAHGILALKNGDQLIGYPAAVIQRTGGSLKGVWDLWLGTQVWEHPDRLAMQNYRAILAAGVAYLMQKHKVIDLRKYGSLLAKAHELYHPPSTAALRPMASTRTYGGVFPKSKAPSPTLDLIDISTLSEAEALTAASLQGIVNRKQPRIYTLWTPFDRRWLDWLKELGVVERENPPATLSELIAKYRDELKGCIVNDPDLLVGAHLAAMLAATRDAIIVSSDQTYGLPVSFDLRERFKTNAQALQWAVDNLYNSLDRNLAVCIYPDKSHFATFDYHIANRAFVFWVTGQVDGERPGSSPLDEIEVIENLFARMPVNIPVRGFWWSGEGVGLQEGPGVTLGSLYGKFTVVSDLLPNLTVHSGTRPTVFRQRTRPAPKLDRTKVYLSFIMSDGDNQMVFYDSFLRLWEDPARGRVPIGWSLGPSGYDTMPDVFAWYYRSARATDEFVCAVSGVGYIYADSYGAAFPSPGPIFDGFLELTADYMRKMDLTILWPMGVTDRAKLRRYLTKIPSIQALFPDYGRQAGMTLDRANYLLDGIPVFHAMTNWVDSASREQSISHLVNDIRRQTQGERPAFLHAFALNWRYTPSMLEEVAQRLGAGYEVVRPSELATLFKQSQSR